MTADRLFELALKRLVRRERSLAELRDYLESKIDEALASTEAAELIDRVLQKLVSLRYIDDDRMAAAIVREQRRQSRGPRAAWMKLKARGISGWTLERVEEVWRQDEQLQPSESEVETARRWAMRRYRGLSVSDPGSDRAQFLREKQRALAALVRRGYSFSIARQALELEESAEDGPAIE